MQTILKEIIIIFIIILLLFCIFLHAQWNTLLWIWEYEFVSKSERWMAVFS